MWAYPSTLKKINRTIIILDLIRHGDKLGDPKIRSLQGKDKLG